MAAKKKASGSKSLAKPATDALAPAPDYIEHGSADGLENMRGQDMEFPRLVLMQRASPEVEREEAEAGSCIHSLTRAQVLAKDEEGTMIPILHFVSWIEWRDRDEGGGIANASMDPGSALAAKAAKREVDDKGKPIVTEYHNFVVFLPGIFEQTGDPMSSVIMIPCAKTNYKHGRRLLMLARMRNAPLYAGRYTMYTDLVERNDYRWYELKFENAGWASEDEYAMAKELHEQYGPMLKQGRVKYVPEDDTDFEGGAEAAGDDDVADTDEF